MPATILATKLYVPPPRLKMVPRPRLIERLNEGLHSKLILISAPAGFGKTTLISAWAATCQHRSPEVRVAWLSLDERDNDPARFLTYLIAALRTINKDIGTGLLSALGSPQPPSSESILTVLLNEIATFSDEFILVLDDYHLLDARAVDEAITFLLEHLPPHLHLVIATREDPHLPLARLRVRGQLSELRVADLRFTPGEAAGFLNQGMGLNLSAEDITALETRTEGWIAGLQLAAISMQGHPDATGFIKFFTGSHHFVLDYLVEEVLQKQSESLQNFLLCTSILERMCGPLCDALLLRSAPSGQETLKYIESVNLFIIPLDNERRWYRYHHLFADLLRQRLHQRARLSTGAEETDLDELHKRASAWYEDNDLELEAFQHAIAANDVERAARLMEGRGMPLQFRGALAPVLNWLASLPPAELDARPALWVSFASALSMTGQTAGVEEKLQAAETALAASPQAATPDAKTRNLIGHIAAIRALLAAAQYQVEDILSQSRRALEYLHPDNLPVRTATIWKMGIAYQLRGERAAASQAYGEAMSISQASGNRIINMSAATGLGSVQESQNQLSLATETYQRILQLAGEPPLPAANEAYLGLARIAYQRNDLDAAQRYSQKSLELARPMENSDRYIPYLVFHARLKLALGDLAGADTLLEKCAQFARQHNFPYRLPEVAAVQVTILLRQGNLAAAAELAQAYEMPVSQARVHLAQGQTPAALELLEPLRRELKAKDWQDEHLQVTILQTLAFHAQGEKDRAGQLLAEALALAEPDGFIRIFVDEGQPMAQLLSAALVQGLRPGYVRLLLAAFESEKPAEPAGPEQHANKTGVQLVEALSQRELEVLKLIAHGLSNHEIGERLFLAVSTVKGHNRIIFDKLQVQRRTEAVARARELGLLPTD